MNLGNSIRTLRKNTGEKQTVFAKNIGISQTHLSQIERGKKHPSTDLLLRIAEHVKVPLPVLFWFAVEESDFPEKKRVYKVVKPWADRIIGKLINESPLKHILKT